MAGKFTVFTGKSGETYFDLKARNGEIILKGRSYEDKAGALDGSLRCESMLPMGPTLRKWPRATATRSSAWLPANIRSLATARCMKAPARAVVASRQ